MPAEVFLRTNTLRTDVDTLIAELASEEIQSEKIFDSCIKLVRKLNMLMK